MALAKIELITQLAGELEQKIAEDDLEDIAQLLSRYAEMINEHLVSFHAAMDAETLRFNVSLLQQYNQRAIQLLGEKQAELKNNLYNLHCLKQYISA